MLRKFGYHTGRLLKNAHLRRYPHSASFHPAASCGMNVLDQPAPHMFIDNCTGASVQK
jgi:hypothetical protein